MKQRWGAVLIVGVSCAPVATTPTPPPTPVAAPATATPAAGPPSAASSPAVLPPPPAAEPVALTLQPPIEPAAPEPNTTENGEPAASVDRSLAAASDPKRLLTHSVFLRQVSTDGSCAAGGQQVPCAKLADGPLIVTDVATLATCTSQVWLGAGSGATDQVRELSWVVSATHPGTHGARLFVAEGHQLFAALPVAKGARANAPACALTWAGFRPRALPPLKSKTAPDNPYR